MATQLAFRTPPGSVAIPVGQSKLLGSVDVHSYERIRVLADERVGSAGNVVIHLIFMEGTSSLGELDTITLTPHSEVTKVYEVPGTTLEVSANAVGSGSGSASVDVVIYGYGE
jgi:hypothetical protein